MGAAVMFDRDVAEWVRRAHPLDKAAWYVRVVKAPGTFWVTLAVAGVVWIFHRKSWRAALPLLLSGPLVGLAYLLLKWTAGRHRPVPEIVPFQFHPFAGGWMGLVHSEKGLSFPSGHTATAFATATCLAALLPAWSAPIFAVALMVAAERVLENAHYLSDVIAGAGVGVLCGWVAILIGRWLTAENKSTSV